MRYVVTKGVVDEVLPLRTNQRGQVVVTTRQLTQIEEEEAGQGGRLKGRPAVRQRERGSKVTRLLLKGHL